jgi:hypothetical protein|tara:strand:- start:1022 stop:1147 length:126 start_codon:yes stop_codon:yes gene_type:complete
MYPAQRFMALLVLDAISTPLLLRFLFSGLFLGRRFRLRRSA